MPLGPEDVIRKTFKTSIFKRGYDETEVDNFLEEVVADLRRREQEKDDLLVQVQRPRSVQEVETDRVLLEREQLDLIRTERQELVSELGGLQARLTGAREEIDRAEERAREASVAQEEAEACRDDAKAALTALEAKVARSQAIHDDLRGAVDSLVAELRGLRTDAETRALDILGRQPVEPAGTPQDDIAVVAEIARTLHDHHVSAGEAEGARLRDDARAAAEKLIAGAQQHATQFAQDAEAEHARLVAEGQAGHERLLSEGQAEHERLLSEGQAEHQRLLDEGRAERDRLVTEGTETNQRLVSEGQGENLRLLAEGRAEHDRLLEAGRTEHQRLVAEAEEQRAGILADLQARRELLDRRISALDKQQAQYRDQLRALVQQQLNVLDDDGWRGDLLAAGSGSQRTAVP